MPPQTRAFRALATLLTGALASSCGGDPSSDPGAAPAPEPTPVSTSPGTEGAVPLVDPFVGTGDAESPDPVGNGKGGSTFPGAALPFGMVQWSPDTPTAAPPGYFHGDDSIYAFSMTHLNGAGCSALRDFPIFPVVGAIDPSLEPSSTFSHDTELASPGFYEVVLDSGVKVDLTATTRTGLGRFTFPAVASAKILIGAGGMRDLLQTMGFEAQVAGTDIVTGTRDGGRFCAMDDRYTIHFAARFDRPFSETGTWHDGAIDPGAKEVSGARSGIYVGFDATQNRAVHMKVGLSYVSVEAALANLDAENPGWDFDAVHAAAIDTWNEHLGRVEIEGGTDEERRSFYTALYHVLLQPATFSDVDGRFVGFDREVHQGDYVRYANFSGWDVYRSWAQLVAVLFPEETSDIARSLVESGEECGALPKWSLANDDTGVMVGDPASATLANAWAFGARGFDPEAALDIMQVGASEVGAKCNVMVARPGLGDYLERQYCSIDGDDPPWGPPSTTLEYAIADFSIGALAAAVGDAATRDAYLARGLYWKNVFDPAAEGNGFSGYVAPRRHADEAGAPSFVSQDPASTEHFVEGNAAQYTFMVPHDVGGLIEALGGDGATVARLDHLFTELNAGVSRPYFYMGNEPQFGTPWLYPFAGAPWRTQAVVRRILGEAFSLTPGGIPGNDDLGATSSWQVWAMLGLYPAVPGVGGFVLGSPLFPKATLTLAGGKKLVITAESAGAGSPYVTALEVDGEPSTSTWLPWERVAGGATLDFTLASEPDETWGTGAADRPPLTYGSGL